MEDLFFDGEEFGNTEHETEEFYSKFLSNKDLD